MGKVEKLRAAKEKRVTEIAKDPLHMEYCQNCGKLLPKISGGSKHRTCKSCGWQVNVDDFEGLTTFTKLKFKKQALVEDEDNKPKVSGPLTTLECPKCGNDKMMSATQQTRSADEGMTCYYTCPKCWHRFVENS